MLKLSVEKHPRVLPLADFFHSSQTHPDNTKSYGYNRVVELHPSKSPIISKFQIKAVYHSVFTFNLPGMEGTAMKSDPTRRPPEEAWVGVKSLEVEIFSMAREMVD